jgi:hypothetical protein
VYFHRVRILELHIPERWIKLASNLDIALIVVEKNVVRAEVGCTNPTALQHTSKSFEQIALSGIVGAN